LEPAGNDLEASLAGLLLGAFALAGLVYVLLGGLVLKGSVRLVEGKAPSYGRALATVLLATIVMVAVSAIAAFALQFGGLDLATAAAEPAMAAAFLASQLGFVALEAVVALPVHATVVQWLLPGPDGRRIGFGRALLIALVYLMFSAVWVCIAAAVAVVVIAVLMASAFAG
jgi:hypothetical protein